jgi:hypothetical protein
VYRLFQFTISVIVGYGQKQKVINPKETGLQQNQRPCKALVDAGCKNSYYDPAQGYYACGNSRVHDQVQSSYFKSLIKSC